MDGDGQNDPKYIKDIVEELRKQETKKQETKNKVK